MDYRRFGDKIFLRLDPGDEIIGSIKTVCENEKIFLADIKGLGAIKGLSVGLFDTEEKKFHGNEYDMPLEITSLFGTVTLKDQEVYLHLHISAADIKGNVYGGHLVKAFTSATCEIVIDGTDGYVGRKFDEKTGLNIFDF